jgi:hypothetical protein
VDSEEGVPRLVLGLQRVRVRRRMTGVGVLTVACKRRCLLEEDDDGSDALFCAKDRWDP